jgi:molybdopterin molybdotransferase
VLSFEAALAHLLSLARPLGPERVSLEQADGRVLAEDVVAPYPLPRFDHSSMDGYAVSTSALSGEPPFELTVRGVSAAGASLDTLEPGAAMRIYTGARIPPGADAVVMQEDVERTDSPGGARVRLGRRPDAGAWIRVRGSDLAEGAIALGPGARLGPGQVALAAALDRPTLVVHRRPTVTILGSGDELRSPGEPDRAGAVVESNGYFVASAARRAGADARIAPFMSDDLDAATAATQRALASTDVLVTVGGVSVGDRDVVRPALEAAGVSIEFYRVAMKPGKPLTVGRRGETLVLGLPGNPASASLTFLLFGVPLLRALSGDRDPLPQRRDVVVRGRHRRGPGRTEFVRARLGEGGVATLLPNQASGAVTSFAEADALVVVPAEHGDIEDGARMQALRLNEVFA